MKKQIFTTVYDDVLNKMETMTRKNFDERVFKACGNIMVQTRIVDRKKGYADITLTNRIITPRWKENVTRAGKTSFTPEQQRIIVSRLIYKGVLFSAKDIQIYRILISHYINYGKDGIATIDLNTIHNVYRGKNFLYKKGKERFDEKTLQAYKESFRKLTEIDLYLSFSESNLESFRYLKYDDKVVFSHKLLQLDENVDIDDLENAEINYTLGDFGDYIVGSRQYGQIIPKEIFHLRFSQIDTYNMAIYIARMIVINKRSRKDVTIYISTILSRIIKYDKYGFSQSGTYLEYLKSLEPVKRNKKIKYIEKQLNYILELLVTNKKISKYKYIGKFNYKYIKDEELAVKIRFIKRK